MNATSLVPRDSAIQALPKIFSRPEDRPKILPSVETLELVRSQVDALLSSTAAFHDLPEKDRKRMSTRLTDIAAYAAECARDVYSQSQRLGQRPVIRHREFVTGPVATAQADEFSPKAVSQVARVTQETLKAVAFPAFVADLIRSTFNAIIQANTQQLEAFQKLLENVQKTVDQFMDDNISDDQARDWLQASFPDHIQVQSGKATAKDGAEDKPSHFKESLHLDDEPSLDDDTIEDTLVPAARRKLAESRLQLLSTMVLMGINRIVITGGKIRATMGFHIDATDRSHQEHATDTDFRVGAAGSFGYGPWSVSASTSFAYVTSTRSNSDDQIHVDTDLTGEVELHFKSDYLPVERFLGSSGINTIRSNTPVPENNPLNSPFSAPPPVGGTVTPYKSAQTSPQPTGAVTLPPIGSPLPPPRTPTPPTPPKVDRHVDPEKDKKAANDQKPASDQKPATAPKDTGAAPAAAKPDTKTPLKNSDDKNKAAAPPPADAKVGAGAKPIADKNDNASADDEGEDDNNTPVAAQAEAMESGNSPYAPFMLRPAFERWATRS